MRILILNEDLGLGGVETMTIELANSLSRQAGCEVYVAASVGPLRERLLSAVGFVDIPKLGPTTIPALFKNLANAIDRTRPHIIHSQGASIAFLSRLAARRRNHSSIHLLTRHSRKTEKVPKFPGNRIMKWSCDHVIAISRSTYNDLRRGGFDAEDLSLIPNFLNLQNVSAALSRCSPQETRKKLGIEKRRLVIAMAGRMIPAKRFDRFIEIIANVGLVSGDKPVGLVLGDGVERPRLQALADQHAEFADIRFLGYQEDVYPFLAASNLYLFPSEHPEVLPMALIEALAAGLPIVCSDIPGNRDVITDGYNGLIVKGPNSAYAERLIKLLGDEQLTALLSANARKTASQEYDLPAVVEKVLKLYRDLVKGAGSRDSEAVTSA